ncbi:MAG: restriction endonuclease [Acidobacteria bacterium]|nr:restriction endonuclease [Acidobacteriota bacterium]
MSPGAFERLSQELLRSSGFEAVKVIGGSGDGGIDGTALYRFSLISFPVYFQCKRHKGSIGAPVVRDFRGAMAGRSDRGLIITTGSFTSDAKREATRDGATPLDLIDGDSLCELLKERGLGVVVRERTVEDVTIDSEYFDRFEGASGTTQRPSKEPEGGAEKPPTEHTRRSSPRAVRWSYLGEDRSEKNAAAMYEHIVGQLYSDHGGVSFYRTFRARIATNTRSHIGESPKEADPEERSIRALPGGWYLNVHSGNQQKLRWIQAACECAGIAFGKELIVEFRTA